MKGKKKKGRHVKKTESENCSGLFGCRETVATRPASGHVIKPARTVCTEMIRYRHTLKPLDAQLPQKDKKVSPRAGFEAGVIERVAILKLVASARFFHAVKLSSHLNCRFSNQHGLAPGPNANLDQYSNPAFFPPSCRLALSQLSSGSLALPPNQMSICISLARPPPRGPKSQRRTLLRPGKSVY